MMAKGAVQARKKRARAASKEKNKKVPFWEMKRSGKSKKKPPFSF
jgi:hypothetical protein